MKSTSLFVLSLISMLFIGCKTQNSDQTILSGSLENSNDTYMLFSKLENVSLKKYILVDTIFVDNNGYFEYFFKQEPGIYQLKGINGESADLAINLREQITISNNDDEFHVTGSVDTDKLNEYETFRKASLDRLVLSVRREIKALTNKNVPQEVIIEKRAQEVANYSTHLSELADFAKENLNNSLALVPTSLRWNTQSLEIYETLTDSFKEKYGEISSTRQLEDKIELLHKTKIGAQFPKVEMISKEAKKIALNNTTSELTLIDFWASWCPPCRVESPVLNELYSDNSRKEFNIYGISLDTNRKRWEDALEKDLRTWDNVSELKGLKTPIAVELGITALPYNFLIDKQGKIVASNIHGEELKQFVKAYLNSKSL